MRPLDHPRLLFVHAQRRRRQLAAMVCRMIEIVGWQHARGAFGRWA
jgi:hypothetical protein